MKIDEQIKEIISRVGAGMSTWEDATVLRGYIIGLVGRVNALEDLVNATRGGVPHTKYLDDHRF